MNKNIVSKFAPHHAFVKDIFANAKTPAAASQASDMVANVATLEQDCDIQTALFVVSSALTEQRHMFICNRLGDSAGAMEHSNRRAYLLGSVGVV